MAEQVSYVQRREDGRVTRATYAPRIERSTPSGGREVIVKAIYRHYEGARRQEYRAYIKSRKVYDKEGRLLREERYKPERQSSKQWRPKRTYFYTGGKTAEVTPTDHHKPGEKKIKEIVRERRIQKALKEDRTQTRAALDRQRKEKRREWRRRALSQALRIEQQKSGSPSMMARRPPPKSKVQGIALYGAGLRSTEIGVVTGSSVKREPGRQEIFEEQAGFKTTRITTGFEKTTRTLQVKASGVGVPTSRTLQFKSEVERPKYERVSKRPSRTVIPTYSYIVRGDGVEKTVYTTRQEKPFPGGETVDVGALGRQVEIGLRFKERQAGLDPMINPTRFGRRETPETLIRRGVVTVAVGTARFANIGYKAAEFKEGDMGVKSRIFAEYSTVYMGTYALNRVRMKPGVSVSKVRGVQKSITTPKGQFVVAEEGMLVGSGGRQTFVGRYTQDVVGVTKKGAEQFYLQQSVRVAKIVKGKPKVVAEIQSFGGGIGRKGEVASTGLEATKIKGEPVSFEQFGYYAKSRPLVVVEGRPQLIEQVGVKGTVTPKGMTTDAVSISRSKVLLELTERRGFGTVAERGALVGRGRVFVEQFKTKIQESSVGIRARFQSGAPFAGKRAQVQVYKQVPKKKLDFKYRAGGLSSEIVFKRGVERAIKPEPVGVGVRAASGVLAVSGVSLREKSSVSTKLGSGTTQVSRIGVAVDERLTPSTRLNLGGVLEVAPVSRVEPLNRVRPVTGQAVRPRQSVLPRSKPTTVITTTTTPVTPIIDTPPPRIILGGFLPGTGDTPGKKRPKKKYRREYGYTPSFAVGARKALFGVDLPKTPKTRAKKRFTGLEVRGL